MQTAIPSERASFSELRSADWPIPRSEFVVCRSVVGILVCSAMSHDASRYLTGIAPVLELHYTTTLQDYRGVADVLAPVYAGTDSLDLTAGVHFQMGPCSMLTVGGVVPLQTSPRDKEFDTEALVQFDRRF